MDKLEIILTELQNFKGKKMTKEEYLKITEITILLNKLRTNYLRSGEIKKEVNFDILKQIHFI